MDDYRKSYSVASLYFQQVIEVSKKFDMEKYQDFTGTLIKSQYR